MKTGKVERQEFEYIRQGTQILIAGFDVATGNVMGAIGETRTEQDFAEFLNQLQSLWRYGKKPRGDIVSRDPQTDRHHRWGLSDARATATNLRS